MKKGEKKFLLSNRWLYSFIILGILIIAGVGVYAATYPASGAGHNADEIDWGDGPTMPWLQIAQDNQDNFILFHDSMDAWYSVGIDKSDNKFKINYGNTPGLATHFSIDPNGGINTNSIATNSLDSKNGFYSSADHAGTGNAAYFPYGFYSPSGTNWIYGTTYLGSGADTIYFRGSTITGTGPIYAGSFIYSSDKSLKTNITQLNNALEKVKQLEGVSFNWKETGRKDMGLIAQDVEKVIPEIVHTSEEGLKSVEYGNLVAILIEAVKEQQEEIDSLQKQIDELRN